MIVAITGHRARDLTNTRYVEVQLGLAFRDLRATKVIQGMCDGADLLAARQAYSERIPYVAVRPWATHTVPQDWKHMYAQAEKYAEHVEIINLSTVYPGPWVYHERNHWMVDRAEVVVAVWNGTKSGGTYATVEYAKKKGRSIWRIDPVRMEVGWLQ